MLETIIVMVLLGIIFVYFDKKRIKRNIKIRDIGSAWYDKRKLSFEQDLKRIFNKLRQK